MAAGSGTAPDPVPTRTSDLPRTGRQVPANAPIQLPSSFDQLRAQAAESVTRDAWRLREVAEIYREQYRSRLDEWVQLRARVDHRVAAARGTGPSPSVAARRARCPGQGAGAAAVRPEADRRRRPPAGAGADLPGQRRRARLRADPLRGRPLAGRHLAEDHPGPGGGAPAPRRGGPRRPGPGPDQRHLPGRVPRSGDRRLAGDGARRARLPAHDAARGAGRGPLIHHRPATADRSTSD